MLKFNITQTVLENSNSFSSIDLSDIPMIKRRRLPPVAKLCFSVIQKLNCANCPIIFASQNAELERTLNIIRSFDDEVSPAQFSLSVHNAIPGLLSILNKNKSIYTSIDCNSGIIETSIIDAVSMLNENDKVMIIYFEDNQPTEYKQLEEELHKITAFGMLLEKGQQFSISFKKNQTKANSVEKNLMNISSWLSGLKNNKLTTNYNRLVWEWCFGENK